MIQLVSITSQGQVTIPKKLLRELGINGPSKAFIKKKGKLIVVEPKKDFWSLGGSLKSDVKLSNKQLREARQEFSKKWPQL